MDAQLIELGLTPILVQDVGIYPALLQVIEQRNREACHGTINLAIGNSLRRRLACVRAEEEKLKLMLQLDEVQLRLKSAEFSKPATSRVRKRKNGTG